MTYLKISLFCKFILNRLVQIDGSFMLFKDTPGSTETSETKWCGKKSFLCPSCVSDSKGNSHTSCGSRMASPRLAAKLNRLASMLKWEYGLNSTENIYKIFKLYKLLNVSDKLYVIQGWFEPSWNQPDSTYPTNSPYREGRAAKIALTKDLKNNRSPTIPPEADTDPNTLQRIAELAVCAGFDFVGINQDYVEVGVIKEKSLSVLEKSRFDEIMQSTKSCK